jgi:hypothetical protein
MFQIKSIRAKIITLIAISALVFIGWNGMIEVVYAKFLLTGTNSLLSLVANDTKIEVENLPEGYQFKVTTRIDGNKANYPQTFGSILQPFIIVLSWQLFLLFVLEGKFVLKSSGVNIGVFYTVQMFFLVMLTGYYTSEIQKFIFDLLIDSFYIFALVLVIKDNMLYPVFSKKE